MELSRLQWRKSSYSSSDEGGCVDFTELACGAGMRDSKHPELGHLEFGAAEWRAFLAAVRGADL